MAATGPRSGDQVLARYPGLVDGTEPGITVVRAPIATCSRASPSAGRRARDEPGDRRSRW
jgi:hypothetical protein